jgi:hypothetical protein
LGKIKNPKRFSEEFRLVPELLRDRGAFDPLLNADTLLFIDPLLLEASAHAEMQAAHAAWVEHFTNIIRLLRVAQHAGDVPWRAAERLFTSPEFKGTCLGYGSGSIAGSGIGTALRGRLLRTARRIVQLGVDDPTLFPLLALLEEDVGPDRISDMTTRVIGAQLAAFTSRVLQGTGIPLAPFRISGQEFYLPANPYVADRGHALPVVLTPQDVMRALPIASDWSDVDRVKAENAALRARINEAIGAIWMRHTTRSKAENRAAFLRDRESFESLIAAAQAIPKRAYDFEGDPTGLAAWLELGQSLAAANPLAFALQTQNVEGVRRVLNTIVGHFQHTIEQRGLWRSLYDSDGQPHHESYAQRLFFAMALSYCKANDVGIDPESNAGSGPVDFVVSRGFHARVAVELKLSTNPRLKHGYTTQLGTYKASQETEAGLFVILNVGSGDRRIEEVLRIEAEARRNGQKHSPVIVVDATPKEPASRRQPAP